MKSAPNAIEQAVAELQRLPGVGRKTARRFAFYILSAPESFAAKLAGAITDLRERIRLCERCCNLTEVSPCTVCASLQRNSEIVCVVERPTDVDAIERTGEFRGLYHVLHGVLSPLEGVGPDDLKLTALFERLRTEPIREIVVATNPSVNGEATATYIHRLVAPLGMTVSRIAQGVPMGSDIEFADKVTLGRALAGRRPL